VAAGAAAVAAGAAAVAAGAAVALGELIGCDVIG